MGLRIHTNVASLNARRHLGGATLQVSLHTARLSSGQRIARAGDDAAGLGVSERMRAVARSQSVALRGIRDGIGLLRVAEGALDETSGLTSRIRELAMQASNGLTGDTERHILENERAELAAQAKHLIDELEYNGQQVFPASGAKFDLQVDATNSQDERIVLEFEDIDRVWTTLEGMSFETVGQSRHAQKLATLLIDYVSEMRGTLGAAELRLESAMRSLDQARTSFTDAGSRIRDADVAIETAGLLRASILQQGSTAVLAQANSSPNLALSLLAGGGI